MLDISLPFELRFSKDNKKFNLCSEDKAFNYDGVVNEEIISLMEYKFIPYRRRYYYLGKMYNDLLLNLNDEKLLQKYLEYTREIAGGIAFNILPLGQILWSAIYDCNTKTEHDILNSITAIQAQTNSMFPMQMYFANVLVELANFQMECEDRKNIPTLENIASFDTRIKVKYENNKSDVCYLIDSIEVYLNLLFYAYALSHPNVSVCQNCGELFIPKTKKVTLYCDRVTSDGLTCKIVGARCKHKSIINSDPVLKKYEDEKNRIRQYCARDKVDKHDFINDYYDWLEIFEPKITKYRNGNYDGNKLIEEINAQTPNFQAYSKGKNYSDEEGYN